MDRHAIYLHGHAKNDDFPINFAIFTKALPTDGPTDRRTNGLTDQQTNQEMDRQMDQLTDIPFYRDAIAASKNGGKWSELSFHITASFFFSIFHSLSIALSNSIFHYLLSFTIFHSQSFQQNLYRAIFLSQYFFLNLSFTIFLSEFFFHNLTFTIFLSQSLFHNHFFQSLQNL